MPEQDIIIKGGVDNLDINEDNLSPEFHGEILEEPFRRGWSFVISS
jgi:hypothetical protein